MVPITHSPTKELLVQDFISLIYIYLVYIVNFSYYPYVSFYIFYFITSFFVVLFLQSKAMFELCSMLFNVLSSLPKHMYFK